MAGRTMRIRSHFATADHNVPTWDRSLPLLIRSRDCKSKHWNEIAVSLKFRFTAADPRQGIVHVIGPELNFTQPGMTIVCGDSHTSTHGAFGALAFSIGTVKWNTCCPAQCLLLSALNHIQLMEFFIRELPPDLALFIIRMIGTGGAIRRDIPEAIRVRDDRTKNDALQHVD
jgi:3-isopropylmalate/(R)-2-methylmalate dehydratase large subunit